MEQIHNSKDPVNLKEELQQAIRFVEDSIKKLGDDKTLSIIQERNQLTQLLNILYETYNDRFGQEDDDSTNK